MRAVMCVCGHFLFRSGSKAKEGTVSKRTTRVPRIVNRFLRKLRRACRARKAEANAADHGDVNDDQIEHFCLSLQTEFNHSLTNHEIHSALRQRHNKEFPFPFRADSLDRQVVCDCLLYLRSRPSIDHREDICTKREQD